MSYTFGSIKTKIRNITGRQSTDQLSESDLEDFVDNFYQVTLPNTLKTDEMLQPYAFQTVSGTDSYAFPTSTFYTLKPDARCDGSRLFWYNDANLFYSDFPEQIQEEELADGDDATVNFTGTLDNVPILIDSLIVYDGVEILLDNGDGTLTGDAGGSGTIDYTTGAYNVTFAVAPTSDNIVKTKYEPITLQKPTGILLYNNELILRGVPDDLYNITMNGYIKPSAMADDTATPFSNSMAPLIIYGTALEIFSENGDLEHYGQYYPIYLKYLDVALDKTTENLSSTRAIPYW